MTEHRPALMAHAMRLTGADRAWAEEVVQDTLTRAWLHLDRMTAEYGSVRSWLAKVAHNIAVDGHRARRSIPTPIAHAEVITETEADHSSDVVGSIRLEQLLGTLSPPHRAVLEAVYVYDRSLVDTAQQLGIPVGTVKSRVFYALRELRTHACTVPEALVHQVVSGTAGLSELSAASRLLTPSTAS